jgi:hypothetical protein
MRRTGSLVAVCVSDRTHLVPRGVHDPVEFAVNQTPAGDSVSG